MELEIRLAVQVEESASWCGNLRSRRTKAFPWRCKSLRQFYRGVLELQAVAGIKNPEKRPTPLFLNIISVLQYKKEFLFLASKIPNYTPQILNASAS